MKERLATLLEELCLLDGLPGQEQPVVRYLKERFQPSAEEVHIGVNGNIYARKTGRKPGLTVLVSAHTDEIGLVVRDIDSQGAIRFDKLGWFSDSFLPGTRVRIGKIPGMVGIKSGHLMTEEEKRTVLPHRSLYISAIPTRTRRRCRRNFRGFPPFPWGSRSGIPTPLLQYATWETWRPACGWLKE